MLVHLTADEDRQRIHQLRDQAEDWLESKGIDQFRVGERAKHAHSNIDALFECGNFYGWHEEGEIKAVAALTSHDPDFWSPKEMSEPAAYVSRFLVAEHGRGWGVKLLDAIIEKESKRGMQLIRLDCWRTNKGLHEYYKRHGFTHVRTMEVPGRMSGALFQRAI